MSIFKKALDKYKHFQESLDNKTESTRLEKQINNETPPYTHCLNCGSELHGIYCHKCGQQAEEIKPKMKNFIWEYLSNTYPVDTQILPTLWNLIRRPGYITNEFFAGKYKSYVHPLKLHLLFIFVIVTMMVIFSTGEKIDNTIEKYTNDELVVPINILASLELNSELSEKILSSEKEKVLLYVPVEVTEDYAKYFSNVEIVSNIEDGSLDTLWAEVPRMLIDDELLVGSDAEGYRFMDNLDELGEASQMKIISMIWDKMSSIISQYVPLIIIFLIPFVAFSTKILYRRRKRPYMHYFVFTLHYSAFLELLLFSIFLIAIIFKPDTQYLSWIMILLTVLYLSIGLKRVFNDKYYILSLFKSVLINTFYMTIVGFVLTIIFIISVASVIE